MHASPSFPYLREILLFLVLAGVLIPLLRRLRVNQVVGFLAAGTLLGPYGLGALAGGSPWIAAITFPELQGVAVLAAGPTFGRMATSGVLSRHRQLGCRRPRRSRN